MKGGNGSGERVMRSSSDKERTKLRERQRRSITTKIFNGLRQHGNYNLAPRSDINDVLRALAKEAGWVVEPDGTTYRSKPTKVHVASSTPLDSGPSSLQQCPTCIALRSYGGGIASSSHGGDSSTTASPRRASLQQPSSSSGEGAALGLASASWHLYQPKGWASASSGRNATRDGDAALALSFGSGGSGSAADCLLGGAHLGSMGYVVGAGGPHTVIPQRPFAFFEEARAPNYSTSMASPQRRYPGAL